MLSVTDIFKWSASISGMIAALMVSLDLGRRVAGWHSSCSSAPPSAGSAARR
jgi:hypothetical protein